MPVSDTDISETSLVDTAVRVLCSQPSPPWWPLMFLCKTPRLHRIKFKNTGAFIVQMKKPKHRELK